MFRTLLKSVANAFERVEIPYMIIGGQATLLYGEPRLTQDIDLTIAAGPDRLPDVLRTVEEEGSKVLVDDVEEFVRDTMVLPCADRYSNIRLDCIFSFSPYELDAVARAVDVNIDGTMVRYATAEDLVIHKIFAGRPRDLEDVRGILLRQENVDDAYITTCLKQFDESLKKSYTEQFHEIRHAIEKPKEGLHS